MFFLLVTLAAHHRLLYISAFREAYDDAPGTQNERLVSAVGAMNNEARYCITATCILSRTQTNST